MLKWAFNPKLRPQGPASFGITLQIKVEEENADSGTLSNYVSEAYNSSVFALSDAYNYNRENWARRISKFGTIPRGWKEKRKYSSQETSEDILETILQEAEENLEQLSQLENQNSIDEISEQFEYLDEEDKEEKELDAGDDKIEDLEVLNEDLGVKDKLCGKCEEEITEQFLMIEGNKFHPLCFTCNLCNSVITGGFFKSEEGEYICPEDKQKIDESLKEELMNQAAGVVETCSMCGGDLIADFVRINDNMLCHKICFRCGECGDCISDSYFEKHDCLYCPECFKRKVASYCHRCDEPIMDNNQEKSLMVNGSKYHQQCFTCQMCGKNQREKVYFQLNDDLICFVCNSRNK